MVYRAAWTNEAFELWYILHFMFTDSALGRDSYEPIFTRCLCEDGAGGYTKNRPDMFDVLEGRMPVAMANAEKLEHVNEGRVPADSNPGTSVHLLVKELLPYAGKSKEGGCSE